MLGLHLGLASVLVIGGALALGGRLSPIAPSGDCAIAQLVPDSTLEAESSVITPQAPGSNVDSIQGGATRGANLFYSFEQFFVLTGRTTYFNNAFEIQNIISRVTGVSSSNIDDLIQANGTANLFLINSHGITFGPNATLNIGGSILASTASSLNFPDGTVCGALPPSPTETLSGETVLTNWATLKPSIENRSHAAPATRVTASNRIGEALRMGDRCQRRGEPYS